MAHTAHVVFTADGRRFATRRGAACGDLSVRTPAGARRIQVKATVRDAREYRGLSLR
jgi:hypothetical protein